MQHMRIIVGGALVSAAIFSSCTCNRQLNEPPPKSFEPLPSGFHASGPKPTPPAHVEVAKATPPAQAPTAQVVAAAPAAPPPDMPADFPKDVPIFKDASLNQVQDLANNAHNVIFSTPSSVPDVYKFYQDRMMQSGWVPTQQFQRPEHAFISFKKGDMIANLTIAEDARNPGQQMIAIMYEQQKPLDFDEF